MRSNEKFGLGVMILGLFIVMSGLPGVPFSVINIPGIVEITDVPEISATRIAVGAVIFVLGYVVYSGKTLRQLF